MQRVLTTGVAASSGAVELEDGAEPRRVLGVRIRRSFRRLFFGILTHKVQLLQGGLDKDFLHVRGLGVQRVTIACLQLVNIFFFIWCSGGGGGGGGGAGGSGRTTRTRSVQVFAAQVGASLAVAFEPSAVDGNAGDGLRECDRQHEEQ